jgi:cell division septation protein DedD
MSDEGFREVQLTGKKLVFIFMVGAVVLVVFFLLGVMVGRGVRGPGATDSTPSIESVQATGDPGAVPPPTKPAAGDLDYAALVGGGDAKKAIEPPSTPADAADTPAASPDSSKTAPVPTSAGPAAKSAASKPDQAVKMDAPKGAAAPTAGQWVVQVNAYSKKTAADNVVVSLKKKNFDAFVVQDGPLYKVQIGPFTDRADADRVRTDLQKEGFKPLIKR